MLKVITSFWLVMVVVAVIAYRFTSIKLDEPTLTIQLIGWTGGVFFGMGLMLWWVRRYGLR